MAKFFPEFNKDELFKKIRRGSIKAVCTNTVCTQQLGDKYERAIDMCNDCLFNDDNYSTQKDVDDLYNQLLIKISETENDNG